MQNYTKNINYINSELTFGEVLESPKYSRLIIDPTHPSYSDANSDFSQDKFKFPYLPLYLGQHEIENVETINTNVLRLIIREGDENGKIFLPSELLVLKDLILENINYHRQFYAANKDAFIYLTVRTCHYNDLYYSNSKTWHIDGFQGSKTKRHIVEQNLIWCNKLATEFLMKPMFCEGLNPSRHNINDFFEKNSDGGLTYKIRENGLYFMNPYNIHRVSSDQFFGKRVFVRLNFSPVEIVDPTNTINPMLPRDSSDIRDVRDFLSPYTIDESEIQGFRLK